MDSSLAKLLVKILQGNKPSQEFGDVPSQSFDEVEEKPNHEPTENHVNTIFGASPDAEEGDEKFPTLKELLKKYVGSI